MSVWHNYARLQRGARVMVLPAAYARVLLLQAAGAAVSRHSHRLAGQTQPPQRRLR
jgi:hypothetical protein